MKQEILDAKVDKDTVGLWWLGGAGFAFKTPEGKVLILDPYLSESVERLHGFKRMCLTPLAPEDARCDAVICTHDHTDHLDPDTISVIARNNPQCMFAGPVSCVKGFRDLGIEGSRIVELPLSGTTQLLGVFLHTAPSNHSDLSLDAVTTLLDFGSVRVFHSGDTSLCMSRFQALYDLHPDIVLTCINGNFGNMNAIDAAMMAQQSGAKIAIPHHFWLFVEHGGDPAAFRYACRNFCPDVTVNILKPGEGILYNKTKGMMKP